MYETKAQMKITDIIRGELMDFIYSDDSIEDANHVSKILNELELIDLRFRDIEKECDELRRRNVTLSLKLDKHDAD